MSVKIMGEVWDCDLPRAEKYILLSYADHAAHDGTSVYPSVGRTAWKTGYSRRSVQEITSRLIDMGILIEVGTRGYGVKVYRIDVERLPAREPYVPGCAVSAPPQDEGGAVSSGGVQKTTQGGAETAPKPSCNHHNKPSDTNMRQAPNPSSTDPSDFTIPELKELKRTRSEWEQMLEKEQEGEDRKGAKEYMEDKLWGAKHPAIVIYHEVMDRYPRQNQYRDTIKRVEESGNLELWREIVRAWKMHGWNPYNLAGMLECLEDGRIPSTGNGGSNGRHHDRNRSSTGSKRGTPPLPAGRTRPWTAKELAWIQREQELAAEGKLG